MLLDFDRRRNASLQRESGSQELGILAQVAGLHGWMRIVKSISLLLTNMRRNI